jgi:hypothetical protein
MILLPSYTCQYTYRSLFLLWILVTTVISGVALKFTMFITRIYATNATIRTFPMPVTTRSQKRALTEPSVDLVTNFTSTQVPTSDNAVKDTSPSSNLSIARDTPGFVADLSTSFLNLHTSSSSPSLVVETSSEFFEILKFQTYDTRQCSINNSQFSPHISSVSNCGMMEEDCEDNHSDVSNTPSPVALTSILSALSNQIATLDRSIQVQLCDNEQRLVQENEDFKTNVKAKIDDLRCLILSNQNVTPLLNTPSPSSNASCPSNVTISASSHGPSMAPPIPSDPQSQMMALMVESFTNLSKALSDKSTDSKAEWPKFAGDPKKVRP